MEEVHIEEEKDSAAIEQHFEKQGDDNIDGKEAVRMNYGMSCS